VHATHNREGELPDNEKPELVFALAGPIGTDLHLLAQTLEESLMAYGYKSVQIRVSKLIEVMCEKILEERLSSAKQDDRIKLLMSAGDDIRKQSGKGDGLIPLVIAAIRVDRTDRLKKEGIDDPDIPSRNTCYIIDSLKHPDEVATLRRLYGDNFVLISGFASREERKSRLISHIAKSYNRTNDDAYADAAKKLTDIDAKRDGSRIGQNLRETFPLADLFIRVSGSFNDKLTRFLDLYFSSPYITPNRDEFFMYEAKAKSYRSADLSRQIGAVVIDDNHHLVASGCNEVPIAGGGCYWPDMDKSLDNRDYKTERDFNAVQKVEIIRELIDLLGKTSVVSFPDGETSETIVNELIFGKYKSQFKELRASNLIEFGRVVHAEMNAITEAARRGVKIGGGQIFSTTFPCHMCARHIIASGIKRVVYIEPYPKSMTEELYGNIVSVDADPAGVEGAGDRKINPHAVGFEPFEGVAPTFYRELFEAPLRKDPQGYIQKWNKASSVPKIARISTVHLGLERTLVKAVEQLKEVRLKDVE
jgi:cytidine deaminase